MSITAVTQCGYLLTKQSVFLLEQYRLFYQLLDEKLSAVCVIFLRLSSMYPCRFLGTFCTVLLTNKLVIVTSHIISEVHTAPHTKFITIVCHNINSPCIVFVVLYTPKKRVVLYPFFTPRNDILLF